MARYKQKTLKKIFFDGILKARYWRKEQDPDLYSSGTDLDLNATDPDHSLTVSRIRI
jgi:hypothetical protein